MDWLVQISIATIPAVITGFVSYFSAKRSSDAEIKKVEKNAEIELKKAENELKRIQEEQKYKLKELEKIQLGEIEKYQKMMEIDAKKNENDMVNKMTENFMLDLINGEKGFEDLEEMMSAFQKFDPNK